MTGSTTFRSNWRKKAITAAAAAESRSMATSSQMRLRVPPVATRISSAEESATATLPQFCMHLKHLPGLTFSLVASSHLFLARGRQFTFQRSSPPEVHHSSQTPSRSVTNFYTLRRPLPPSETALFILPSPNRLCGDSLLLIGIYYEAAAAVRSLTLVTLPNPEPCALFDTRPTRAMRWSSRPQSCSERNALKSPPPPPPPP